jgi:hypothetical protein
MKICKQAEESGQSPCHRVTVSPCHRATPSRPCLALAALLLAAGPLRAHALYAECRLRGDRVIVEAFYSDDTPARGAAVTVRDEVGREVAAGRTGETGEWSFARPPAGKYEVTADAGAGHRKRVTMTIPTDTALGTHSPPPEEVVVTAGPTRDELTRFPWLRVALGLGAIAVLAGVLLVALRRRPRPVA